MWADMSISLRTHKRRASAGMARRLRVYRSGPPYDGWMLRLRWDWPDEAFRWAFGGRGWMSMDGYEPPEIHAQPAQP